MISSLKLAGRTRAHAALDQLRGLVCAVATGLACAAPATAAEYLVRPGDVLSLMFIGGSHSTYSIPVEIDGLAWFPIIGGIPVSGLDMAEVRRQVADAYSATSISFGAGGAAELLRPNQVHVGVAQYRPVYVGGSLGQPVVIDYRPGLTLRQALTLAASRQASPQAASDVTERIEALSYEKGRIEARIWRLRAVLGEASPDEFQQVFGSRAPDVRQLASLERSVVEALEGERQRQQKALQDEIQRTEGRITVLLAQREIELEAQVLDDKQAENMRLAPTSEVADARRAALTSATRVLQLDVEIESARSRLTELKVLESGVMVDGAGERWSELADQLVLYHQTEAELSALRASALVADDEPPTQVVITRDTGETIHTTVGDATQALLPGDVIELVTESPVHPYAADGDDL
jgi:polysaccharide export outer membrane protein